MSNFTEVRCPYCLVKRKVSSSIQSKIKCIKCARYFSPQTALPVSSDSLANIPLENESAGLISFALFFFVLIAGNWYVYHNTPSIKGGAFISGYIIFGIVCIILSRLNIASIKTLMLVLFESIGVVRMYAGSSVGMHTYGFLVFSMVIGGALIYSDALSDVFSNKENSSSGCGGGCGSGCGGGCGGCG